MEKRYKIVAKTNGWIASRDVTFGGKCEYVVKDDMSLKEAQKYLLDMYNKDYETSWSNWGLARIHSNGFAYNGADGLRAYEYDSRMYKIEEV